MPCLASPTWRFPLGAVEAVIARGTCGQRGAGRVATTHVEGRPQSRRRPLWRLCQLLGLQGLVQRCSRRLRPWRKKHFTPWKRRKARELRRAWQAWGPGQLSRRLEGRLTSPQASVTDASLIFLLVAKGCPSSDCVARSKGSWRTGLTWRNRRDSLVRSIVGCLWQGSTAYSDRACALLFSEDWSCWLLHADALVASVGAAPDEMWLLTKVWRSAEKAMAAGSEVAVEGVQPLLAPRTDEHLEAAAFRFEELALCTPAEGRESPGGRARLGDKGKEARRQKTTKEGTGPKGRKRKREPKKNTCSFPGSRSRDRKRQVTMALSLELLTVVASFVLGRQVPTQAVWNGEAVEVWDPTRSGILFLRSCRTLNGYSARLLWVYAARLLTRVAGTVTTLGVRRTQLVDVLRGQDLAVTPRGRRVSRADAWWHQGFMMEPRLLSLLFHEEVLTWWYCEDVPEAGYLAWTVRVRFPNGRRFVLRSIEIRL
eukprot:s887_g19.t1